MKWWAQNRRRGAAALLVAITVAGAGCSSDDKADDKADKKPATTTTTTVKPVLSADFTIASILGFDAQFTTLLELATLSKVDATLGETGPFTLFAPNTEAFAKLNADDLAALKADPTGDLAALLSLHVVPGRLSYADLVTKGDTTLESIDGQKLTVKVEGQAVTVGGATLIKTDIQAENGVVHVLDTVATAG